MNKNVNSVTTNVLNVLHLLKIVSIVLKTELKPQLVSVQTDTMIMVLHYVLNVTKNVKDVKTCQTTVLNVFQVELTHQPVIFQNQTLNPLKSSVNHLSLLES
jgi:hypothetical protein